MTGPGTRAEASATGRTVTADGVGDTGPDRAESDRADGEEDDVEWTIERAPDGTDPAPALLTALLARVHAVPPDAILIESTPRGRRARVGSAPVAVALSRSAGWVAAACTAPGESGTVGIDAEAWAPFRDSGTRSGAFADVVLAADERDWFRAAAGATEADRLVALLRTWVRKEAVLKALGTGFDTARGGLTPTAIVLGPPWDPPVCTSHPEIALADHLAGGDDPVLVSTAHRARRQADERSTGGPAHPFPPGARAPSV